MASSKKKRALESNDVEMEEEAIEADEESDDNVSDESENEFVGQEVRVAFEGMPAEDSDKAGIITLLRQLLLGTKINLADLADIIISQNYVGNVLKLDADEDDDDDDDDDAMDDDSGDTVFGVMTAINLTDKKDKECVKQLISLLTSQCQAVNPEAAEKVREMLVQSDYHVGWILNERYVNLPPSVQTFRSLKKDLAKACQKNMKYSFKYFVMLCKTSRPRKSKDKSSLRFTNGEEELIAEMSDFQATWSIAEESNGVAEAGETDESDAEEATRTLLCFSADKFEAIIGKLEKELQY